MNDDIDTIFVTCDECGTDNLQAKHPQAGQKYTCPNTICGKVSDLHGPCLWCDFFHTSPLPDEYTHCSHDGCRGEHFSK